MYPSNDISDQPLPSFEEYPPAFWEDARMWCLLDRKPWLQLNGSMSCGKPYQEYLDRRMGREADERIEAVHRLHKHVRIIRPEGLRAELAQASRNYTTALFIHRDFLTEECIQRLLSGTVTTDTAQNLLSIQAQVIAHLEEFDDGGDFFAFLSWVKSPACWEGLVS
jgi:hypothetical protein